MLSTPGLGITDKSMGLGYGKNTNNQITTTLNMMQ